MEHPFDKKTNTTRVKDKRDIRLEGPPPKKLGAWIRRAAMPVVEKVVADTQFGSGLNAGSTEMTYLVQMAAEGAADARNMSSISLYIDIRSAFAEVQRCLVVEDFKSREVLRQALLVYGLGEDLVAGIVAEVADTGFWQQRGESEHLEAMLRATLENIFASLEGTPGGCRMPQGTGAGNPLADLMFAVAFCKVVAMLRRKLKEAGLDISSVSSGAREFLGIGPSEAGDDIVQAKDSSYADDLGVCVMVPSE